MGGIYGEETRMMFEGFNDNVIEAFSQKESSFPKFFEDMRFEKDGLTNREKRQLEKETGWSKDLISHIDSAEQAEIYKTADLKEAEIGGRSCLIKDIDFDYLDEKTGLTNRERMQLGRPPIDAKTGEKIELHHMGQKYDAPFAELKENSEHGDGNHSSLHPKTEGSWRNVPELENEYGKERKQYWKERAEEAA